MVPTSVPFGCNAAYERSGRPAAAGRMMMITGDSPTPLFGPQAQRQLRRSFVPVADPYLGQVRPPSARMFWPVIQR